MPASLADRLALRVLQIGAIAVVLAASTFTAFELDRFLVPKELALHLTAALAGILVARRVRPSRVDVLLLGVMLLGALSAAMATNRWLALRALAVTASSVALFWAGRALRQAGLERPLLNGIALAVVAAAATALLQAYGVRLVLFATNRAPGGTLGNRNFVGHIAAFGLPVVLLTALRARRVVLASLGVAMVTAALVLTRSRAAWIAAAVVLLIFIVRAASKRLLFVLLFAAGGAAAALLIPNTLHWRSENPYLDSVKGVAGYDAGSGRGRLVQYERSLLMAATHPLLGAGPGNWPVEYPRYAVAGDPSLDHNEQGMTANPWPSSDWIAFLAERGLAAAVLLAFALLLIARGGRREPGGEGAALLATIAAAVIAGLFDAVLLLAAPALLVWTTIGALSPPTQAPPPPPLTPAPPMPIPPSPSYSRLRWPAVLLVIGIAVVGAVRSAGQLAAMDVYSTHGDRASLESAARIDPGNYRLRLRLARIERGRKRCEHAFAAHALFPSAAAARDAARGCRP